MILITKYKPASNIRQSPQTEQELAGIKDALEQKESPQLHDRWIDDIHHEAGDVRHLLRRDGEVHVGHTVQRVTPWLCLTTPVGFNFRILFATYLP